MAHVVERNYYDNADRLIGQYDARHGLKTFKLDRNNNIIEERLKRTVNTNGSATGMEYDGD